MILFFLNLITYSVIIVYVARTPFARNSNFSHYFKIILRKLSHYQYSKGCLYKKPILTRQLLINDFFCPTGENLTVMFRYYFNPTATNPMSYL